MLGADELTGTLFAIILIAAFAAGWIDAVVGGGGLLQLPALMLIPGLAPAQILATNKLASIFGTATSSLTYLRRTKPDLRTAVPMAFIALCGSFAGAFVATQLPASAFKPIVVVALVVVAVLTAARPTMGQVAAQRWRGGRHLAVSGAIGAAIGFYDGMIGPGTGTFLVISLVGVIGYDFLRASATAKIVNFATNLGALLLFVPTGAVIWPLALVLAVANVAGSYLGSRMAIAKGTTFIRLAFLVVVGVLIVKLSLDVWTENIAPLLAP